MRARRPTSAMPKPFLCCERAFCCSMVLMCRGGDLTSFDVMRSVAGWDEAIKVLLQYYSVLQSTTPVLLCTAKYYSSTTLYCKVLFQYYSVLQNTTPVLLSTTQYYNVLLQYYSVLQSITLYCKGLLQYVLLQYYSVLQSTTPVLLCTTKYYSSTTTTSTTLYYKAAFMIDVRRIWNVIYNARSNRSHPPTSRNTAPATQNDCDDWSASHMKRHLQWAEQQESQSIFTKYCTCHAKWMPSVIRVTYETSFPMRGASKVTLQTHQLLRLPRKMNLMIDPRHIWNVIYNARSSRVDASNFTKYCACHAKCISWLTHLECAEQAKSTSNLTKYCPCHAKWISWYSWLIRVTYETSFRMRGASKVNLQPHQILRLPRKMHLMIDPRHTWNVIYNARSKQSQPRTSANYNQYYTVLQSSIHDWRPSHMKRHLQCAEQQESSSNVTKYCTCHAKWLWWLIRITYETSFTMSGATGITIHLHQILHLPRKMNAISDPRHIWNVISNARSK